jgi:hypothetical protein
MHNDRNRIGAPCLARTSNVLNIGGLSVLAGTFDRQVGLTTRTPGAAIVALNRACPFDIGSPSDQQRVTGRIDIDTLSPRGFNRHIADLDSRPQESRSTIIGIGLFERAAKCQDLRFLRRRRARRTGADLAVNHAC